MCFDILKNKDCLTCRAIEELENLIDVKDNNLKLAKYGLEEKQKEIESLNNDLSTITDQLKVLDDKNKKLQEDIESCRSQSEEPNMLIDKALAILPTNPKTWKEVNDRVASKFKADVSVVKIEGELLERYRAWYGTLQSDIVKHPGYNINTRDREYWTFGSCAEAIKAVKTLWVAYLQYVGDRFDCDDFADKEKSDTNSIYGVNAMAYVESEWTYGNVGKRIALKVVNAVMKLLRKEPKGVAAHAWNVIWCPDGALKIEPQSSTVMKWDEMVPEPYQTKNIRAYIR